MAKQSAGIVLYRFTRPGYLEVLLVHPGGPFWAKKDLGCWSIPKGEFSEGEEPFDAGCREFAEETGFALRSENALALGRFRQPSGKVVHAWAVRGDADPTELRSNSFSMEWPPGSGRQQEFPEVDRAAWFPVDEATTRISSGQRAILEALQNALS